MHFQAKAREYTNSKQCITECLKLLKDKCHKDYKDEAKFKADTKIFDILGDTERTGPILWKIDRKRLEDIKTELAEFGDIVTIPFSATKGTGAEEIRAAIIQAVTGG